MNHDHFFSMDRLVEFGLGVAVAQQMARSMNHALENTHVPGSQTPMLAPTARLYYVALDGKAAGPFGETEFSALIAQSRITKDSLVWRPGMSRWEPAENIPEVLRMVAMCPPPLNPKE